MERRALGRSGGPRRDGAQSVGRVGASSAGWSAERWAGWAGLAGWSAERWAGLAGWRAERLAGLSVGGGMERRALGGLANAAGKGFYAVWRSGGLAAGQMAKRNVVAVS